MAKELNVFDLEFQGVHLVESGAGSGKTYSITSLYIRALVERKVLPSQILVLTFTNAATDELKIRLRNRIQEVIHAKEKQGNSDPFIQRIISQIDANVLTHLKRCLFSFDEANISTIHGFCQRVLAEYGARMEIPPAFEIITDDDELVQEAADNFWNEYFFKSFGTSSFQDWSKSYLNLLFRSPDRLLSQIKELIHQPDIILVPGEMNVEDFTEHFDDSVFAFHHMRDVFDKEYETLISFFESDALNGTKYRNKEQLVEQLKAWMNQDDMCPPPMKDLFKFGRFMPEEGLKKNKSAPDLELYKAVDTYLQSFEELTAIEIAFLLEAVQKIRNSIINLKRSRAKLGYNDLLLLTRDGLTEAPGIGRELAKRFPIAFIDEFQDTDHIQYSIFNSIYSESVETCLVLIGDPKQAIYRFRGADLNTYLLARSKVNPDNMYSLTHNYRSGSRLIRGVNAFFSGVKSPFKMDGLTFQPANFPKGKRDTQIRISNLDLAPLQIREFDPEAGKTDSVRVNIANSVASEIVEILTKDVTINEVKIGQSDIAVLVDTHRNAMLIKEILWQYGLRSIIDSRASVFHTEEADEIYRLLVAISNPFNLGYLRSALCTSLLGNELSDLATLEEEAVKSIAASFSELKRIWESDGLGTLFGELEREFNVLINLSRTSNPERSITNYKHLIELLSNEERRNSLTIKSLIRHFRKKRDEKNSGTSEEDIVRLESDDQLIQIVTHHASKGLEYQVVFCPFLWRLSIRKPQIITHSDGQSIRAITDKKRNSYKSDLEVFMSEEESEKLRLAYVALTRAKAMCFVYSPLSSKKSPAYFNAIGYLTENNSEVKNMIEMESNLVHKEAIQVHNKTFKSEEANRSLEIKTATFPRNDLNDYERMVSFSSLTASSGNEESGYMDFDYDADLRPDELERPLDVELNVFGLPKGKTTGNLLHSVFERIDFTDGDSVEPVIDELLLEFGYEPKWKPTILELVDRSLNHDLIDELSLSDIKNTDRLVEMEFYFPIRNLRTNDFFGILGKEKERNSPKIHGFMKGFIDLIFRHKGKYFILDYKSNHLGNSYSDYSDSMLQKEMIHSNYDIQYHIYLLSFLRYMKAKSPGFDYQTDFGGVIYLFLRGIQSGVDRSGVFYHKPELEVINKLDALMNGVEVNV